MVQTNIMDTQITVNGTIHYSCGERQRRKLTKCIGKHNLLLFCINLGDMAPSTVLVLGHSFVRRLKSDLKFQLDSRLSPSFKLDGTARVHMHGIGDRTVTKLRKYDFGVVARLSPDIAILEIGTNDLSFLPPEVVGSEIEELVSQLQQPYRVKVVCVCLTTPRHRNHVFNAKRLILNNYLTVVLEHTVLLRNNLTENAFGTRPERVRNAFVNAFHLRSIRVPFAFHLRSIRVPFAFHLRSKAFQFAFHFHWNASRNASQ